LSPFSFQKLSYIQGTPVGRRLLKLIEAVSVSYGGFFPRNVGSEVEPHHMLVFAHFGFRETPVKDEDPYSSRKTETEVITNMVTIS